MNNRENQHKILTEILIAEDSPTQAELLKYILEQHDYKVVVAKDGKEALWLVHERKPALIISDIQMPVMNGFEFCKQIKADLTTRDIPVILLTSLSASKDVFEGLACGADRFITKPSSESYIITHVKKTLDERIKTLNHLPEIALEVAVEGKMQIISVDPSRVISLMLSTYEAAIGKNIELAEAHDELISFNNNLEELINERTTELSKINAEKDKFFSIIAHDLRGPFSGFLGLTEMMAEGIQDISQAQLTDFSKLLNENARKLFQLLENLLEWAQMQNGSINFAPHELNLFNMVSTSIGTINQRAIQKGITITNDIPDVQKIYADEKMVDSVLRNLLSNAIKFTKNGGIVIIKAMTADNNMTEISVADTGVGMTEDYVGKLFRIDEKIGSQGTEGELSSGLGLLLCKEFVEKNGGAIWVEREVDKGSIFHFTLPQSS